MLPTIASLVTIIIIIIAEILLEADGTTVTIKAYCKYDGKRLIPVTAQSKEHIEIFEKLGYKQVQQQKLDGIFCAFTLVNDEDEKDEELEQQLNTHHSAKKEMDESRNEYNSWCKRDPYSTAEPLGYNEIEEYTENSKKDFEYKSAEFLRADSALDNYMQTAAVQKKKAQNTNTDEKVHGSKGSKNSKTGKEKKDKIKGGREREKEKGGGGEKREEEEEEKEKKEEEERNEERRKEEGEEKEEEKREEEEEERDEEKEEERERKKKEEEEKNERRRKRKKRRRRKSRVQRDRDLDTDN
ncbi:hypothetical protein niasHT_008480 [Heterodera trifolii]|uniref:Effector protein n=1 Tax=Heterodera trifolii TaxID=157864 RepID=A0ABD2M5I5_9BILA